MSCDLNFVLCAVDHVLASWHGRSHRRLYSRQTSHAPQGRLMYRGYRTWTEQSDGNTSTRPWRLEVSVESEVCDSTVLVLYMYLANLMDIV